MICQFIGDFSHEVRFLLDRAITRYEHVSPRPYQSPNSGSQWVVVGATLSERNIYVAVRHNDGTSFHGETPIQLVDAIDLERKTLTSKRDDRPSDAS